MKEIFFSAIFSLAHLSFFIKDKFLRQKLIEKSGCFFDSFLESEWSTKVAHDQVDQLSNSIDQLFELIEILVYLKVVFLSPALLAQKNLLRLQFEIINCASHKNLKKEEERETTHDQPDQTAKLLNKARNLKYQNLDRAILEIIKTKPEGLSLREIILIAPNQCSKRTLQRHLNQLALNGVILKKGIGNSAKYGVTS